MYAAVDSREVSGTHTGKGNGSMNDSGPNLNFTANFANITVVFLT